MKKYKYLFALILAVNFFCITPKVIAQATIDVESGAVFTGYNNVRIPGNTGSSFSLKNDLNAKPNAFIRIRVSYLIKSRHSISLLYAPLSIKSDGSTNKQIDFDGVIFPANTLIDARYKFNSYRLTYRYDIIKRPKFEFGLGLTAKIRDAEIALEGNGISASKKNVGFVPIVNFRLNWKINDKVGLLFEGDALAAPQGRAEDVALSGTYKFSDQFLVRLGYRVLEGGAGNDEVYNFSLIHYASVGLTYNIGKSN